MRRPGSEDPHRRERKFLNISIQFGNVFLIPSNFIFYRHINIFNHFYSSFIVVELSIFFIGLLKQLITSRAALKCSAWVKLLLLL